MKKEQAESCENCCKGGMCCMHGYGCCCGRRGKLLCLLLGLFVVVLAFAAGCAFGRHSNYYREGFGMHRGYGPNVFYMEKGQFPAAGFSTGGMMQFAPLEQATSTPSKTK